MQIQNNVCNPSPVALNNINSTDPIQDIINNAQLVQADLAYFQQQYPHGATPTQLELDPRLQELAKDLNALQQDKTTLQEIAQGPDSNPDKSLAQKLLVNEPFLAIDADLNNASLGGVTLNVAANEFSSSPDQLANLMSGILSNQRTTVNFLTTITSDMSAFAGNPYGKNPSTSGIDPNLPLLEGYLALLSKELNYASQSKNMTDTQWSIDPMLSEISSTITEIASLLQGMSSNPLIACEPSFQALMSTFTMGNVSSAYPTMSLEDAASSGNNGALENMLVSMCYNPDQLSVSSFENIINKFIYANPLT